MGAAAIRVSRTAYTNPVQTGARDTIALMFEGAVIAAVSYEGDVPG
jgi:hypothetical protein